MRRPCSFILRTGSEQFGFFDEIALPPRLTALLLPATSLIRLPSDQLRQSSSEALTGWYQPYTYRGKMTGLPSRAQCIMV